MKITNPHLQEIPQYFQAHYKVDVNWKYLEEHLSHHSQIDLDPDFQRGHVWTIKQQADFVEFCLRGGVSGNDLLFNCRGYAAGSMNEYVLVDGKQRLNAVRSFLANKLPVFGGNLLRDFGGTLRGLSGPSFRWWINDLKTRKEVLTWYLQVNDGGVAHTPEELDRVRDLLSKEVSP